MKLLAACEMDLLPPWDLVESMSRWAIPGNRLDAVPPLFFRALWKGCAAVGYEHRDSHLGTWVGDVVVPLAQ